MKTPAIPQSLALVAALSLGAATASAATLTIVSTSDASIRSPNGATPRTSNTSNIVLVGDTKDPTDYLRGLFSFDLNDPALVGATINSVTLKLYIDNSTGADSTSTPTSVTVQVFQLTRLFTESQVTWSNALTGTPWTNPGGDYSTDLLSSISATPTTVAKNQEFTFLSSANFVSSVAGTLQQTNKTLGLLLKLEIESEADLRSVFRFNSATASSGSVAPAQFHPQLVIDYTAAPIPEPSAFAALAGLGALGAAATRRRRR